MLTKKRVEPRLELLLRRAGHPSVTAGRLIGVSRGVDSERGAKTPTPRASEVDKLRRELKESNKKARRLDEALWKRDHTMVQVKAEKQATMHAKRQMDEEHATLVKLQGARPPTGVLCSGLKP
ncbi:uncharacterized protein A4U43_C01F13890 [Asparagus officinalis]|uniref:Uncharacterized protein n=1 Tax=Asparagus officinalis TaxID=4686 RepID=A0A5P1FTU1_ASPOF|nr:uncharacterized protein A4U43_C01F13890 [Asparagus officinalis]